MMKIEPEFLKLQLAYSQWASERSLQAARALSEEDLRRDVGNSHGGVMGTLTHLFYADRVWLSRLEGAPRTTMFDEGETWTLDTLADAWSDISNRYEVWVSGLSDSASMLHYKNLAGQPASLPLWQVLLHIVNHATYHRGQITTMLRQLGKPPIATDLHVYYLSLGE